MTTKIFKKYEDFLNRENKKENGVTQEFADLNLGWDKESNNEGCWNCSGCHGCHGCSRCSDCSGCYDCHGCSGCYGCSRCSDCSDCSRCSDCSGCSECHGCSGCYDCSGCSNIALLNGKKNLSPENGEKPGFPEIPAIKNIHQNILEIVSKPEALNMGAWHTCETTHCRAGWVVTLAGEEGKKLEHKTSTAFAAMQIYKKSSPISVSPVRFFEDNEKAMKDIERCAALEKELTGKN